MYQENAKSKLIFLLPSSFPWRIHIFQHVYFLKIGQCLRNINCRHLRNFFFTFYVFFQCRLNNWNCSMQLFFNIDENNWHSCHTTSLTIMCNWSMSSQYNFSPPRLFFCKVYLCSYEGRRKWITKTNKWLIFCSITRFCLINLVIPLIRSRSRTFHKNKEVRQNFVHDCMPPSVIYLTGLHIFVCSLQFITYTKIQVIENCFFFCFVLFFFKLPFNDIWKLIFMYFYHFFFLIFN